MDELRQEFEQTPHAELVDHALDQADQIDKLEQAVTALLGIVDRCPVASAEARASLEAIGVDHE